jgi:hypothetical protein
MKYKFRIILIILAPLTFVLNQIFKNFPMIVEKFYSVTINKVMRQVLSLITGIVPISVAEFLLIFLVLIFLYLIVQLIHKSIKGKFIEGILNIAAYLSVVYVMIMFLWGFNYNRLSFDKIADLKIEKSSKQELYELCNSLIVRANDLRSKVKEDERSVMTIEGGYKDVFKRTAEGYKNASDIYSELGGSYGRPKPIMLSKSMTYTGITGIYIPFTAEANVNVNITDFMLPATALHEMAHQRGFAREDEANYISYIACSKHSDADFQYSGTMLALIYSMNALADKDLTAYKELRAKYSEGVARDLKNDAEFWDKYKGKAEKIANKVNNTYLKSNGQEDGVASYGRMVDLLLAEYKKDKLSK